MFLKWLKLYATKGFLSKLISVSAGFKDFTNERAEMIIMYSHIDIGSFQMWAGYFISYLYIMNKNVFFSDVRYGTHRHVHT